GDQPARVQVTPLRLRHQRLREPAQLLRLRDRRFDPAVQDQGGRHVPQHRLPVLARPGKLPSRVPPAMPHPSLRSSSAVCAAAASPSATSDESIRYISPSSASFRFIPKWRLCSLRKLRISSSDFTPKLSI